MGNSFTVPHFCDLLLIAMSRKEMNKTAAALEEKATKYDEILKYTLLDLSEEIVDKMIRPSKAFAQFSVSSVNENFFWRKVIFRHVSEHVVKAVVIEHTHEVEIVEKSSFKSQRCYFFTGQEVKNFQRASGLKPFVYKQTENRDTLITMIQPYGYAIKDCSQEIFNAQYGSLLKEKKWTAVNAKCSAQAGRLSTAYKALNPQLILVEKEEKLDIDGVSHFFFHVVVPDANSSRMVRLMNGVSVRGYSGVIPGTFVGQRFAKCPWFSFRLEKKKAKWTKRLGHFMFCFRPFQVKNGLLQWNIQTLTPVPVSQALPASAITLPEGFCVWDGEGLSEQLLSQSFLLGMPVFFHLYEGEWKHFTPVRFIPANERTDLKPYNYEVRIEDGHRFRMHILFRMNMFNTDYRTAALGSWCILERTL